MLCSDFLKTTIDSCVLDYKDDIDGLEVDVLMSKSKTVWLRHDDFVINDKDTLLFSDLKDYVISKNGYAKYTLEDLLKFITSNDLNFSISLDIKQGDSNLLKRYIRLLHFKKRIISIPYL